MVYSGFGTAMALLCFAVAAQASGEQYNGSLLVLVLLQYIPLTSTYIFFHLYYLNSSLPKNKSCLPACLPACLPCC
jgi:hypothetical protein